MANGLVAMHFPALSTGYMFCKAWYRLHVFPRLSLLSRLSLQKKEKTRIAKEAHILSEKREKICLSKLQLIFFSILMTLL